MHADQRDLVINLTIMLPMKEYNLSPLWNEILGIYDEFSRICHENNLRYFLAFGSALGAVRHGDFIPWDDDFDVMMPRPDYDKFIEIASGNLPSYYKIFSYRNDDNYTQMFIYIKDMRKDRFEGVKRLTGMKTLRSVYMDIFPLDGFPYKSVSMLTFRIKKFFLRCLLDRVLNVRNGVKGSGWRNWIGLFSRCLFPKLRTVVDVLDYNDLWYREHKYDECDMVAFLDYHENILQREWFSKTIEFDFGNRKVPLPVGYDSYLRNRYGDYMKLPPENQRHPSHQ